MNAHAACIVLGHKSEQNAYGTLPKSVKIPYVQVMNATQHA